MINLEKLEKWVNEKKTRSARVTVEPGVLLVWVWDSQLCVGDHVESVDEIDLEAAKERQEREEYKKLKEKFGSIRDIMKG